MKHGNKAVLKRIDGKAFLCLKDQSGPDMDIAALEKRICNRIISENCRFATALDAFAGVGISAYYWAKCSDTLFLLEKRKDAVHLLSKNLQWLRTDGCNANLVQMSAYDFVPEALREKRQFQLIDCDPFGTCYNLLPMVSQLIPHGIVCITSGEIYQVYRGLNKKPGRPNCAEYKGRAAREWVVEKLIPEIMLNFEEGRLIHYYIYPTSVRLIIAVGGYPLNADLFHRRPRLLGWLSS